MKVWAVRRCYACRKLHSRTGSSIRLKTFRKPRRFIRPQFVASWARRAGSAAGAGVRAVPRLVLMDLAHPAAILAEQAGRAAVLSGHA